MAKCCVKTLFCLGNKWIAHLRELLTRLLQNPFFTSITQFSEKAVTFGSFLKVKHTYFRRWWLFLKNLFKNFVRLYHEELSSNTWSMWQFAQFSQFGQGENIPGHLSERGVYLLVLKTAWMFPIPKGRVEKG